MCLFEKSFQRGAQEGNEWKRKSLSNGTAKGIFRGMKGSGEVCRGTEAKVEADDVQVSVQRTMKYETGKGCNNLLSDNLGS